MNFKHITLISVILIIVTGSAFGQIDKVNRSEYLDYATQAVEDYWQYYDEDIQTWVDRIDLENVFGYNPPGNPLSFAYVSAHLFHITGEEKHAERTREVLVEFGDFRNYYPKDFWKDRPGYDEGVPPLANFFTISQYIKAYYLLKDSPLFTKKDRKIIAENIAQSLAYQLRSQEWGPMNRSVLRADAFYVAARALPDHPEWKTWRTLAKSIIDDCLYNWEIEDASLYNAVYEYALISLLDVTDNEQYWEHAVARYKMQFYSRLLAPHGMLPDYGDAHLFSNWHRWVPVFEKAATEFNDPEIKYAASRIAQKFWDFEADKKSMWLANIAIDAYRWANDKINPKAPPGKSELVLDDLVGKKVVFRTGYQKKDTYFLLNFKDEGQSGFLGREYLRLTIPVEEEKMTHGHSDENSIPLFMVDGCVLLHDGGYRDYMPSGPFGAYRADYFHNRVVVRKGKIFKGQEKGLFRYSIKDSAAIPGQNVYDFVRNSGAYRPAETELIDFLVTDEFDYSRSRVTDEKLGFQHDRIVNWVKPLNIFIIFDAVKFLEDDYFTTVNFWHTRKIVDQGDDYFDTQYDSVRNYVFPTHKLLLIYFPNATEEGRMLNVDLEQRNYQKQFAINHALSQWHYQGEFAIFTTVLIPHDTGQDIQPLLDRIKLMKVDRYPQAVGVKIMTPDTTYFVCSKLDRMMDLHHQDIRPQYDYEHGKVKYDDFETDGHQLFAWISGNRLKYTSVYCVKMKYKDKVLFEQLPSLYGLQYTDGVDRLGVGKLRYWQDTVEINQ